MGPAIGPFQARASLNLGKFDDVYPCIMSWYFYPVTDDRTGALLNRLIVLMVGASRESLVSLED